MVCMIPCKNAENPVSDPSPLWGIRDTPGHLPHRYAADGNDRSEQAPTCDRCPRTCTQRKGLKNRFSALLWAITYIRVWSVIRGGSGVSYLRD
ncbi:hypothetical protein Y032_0011g1404 [Ancylostoma ceylanicum]|uniref:Uncharacterized protein n=1 Tax=Ancylostoma ceylanicum TaxID=53326 RepID=A0A016VEU4_9BILA|nr:hypothetical protein Y032_0011g1404 [Ancylostoma ceylanicum]